MIRMVIISMMITLMIHDDDTWWWRCCMVTVMMTMLHDDDDKYLPKVSQVLSWFVISCSFSIAFLFFNYSNQLFVTLNLSNSYLLSFDLFVITWLLSSVALDCEILIIKANIYVHVNLCSLQLTLGYCLFLHRCLLLHH